MLYVLCGLPGSGKTTLAEQLAAKMSAAVHCYDETPGANRRDSYGQAFKAFCQSIKEDLADGKIVIADGTNTQRRKREKILEAAKDIECKRVLIVMDVPLDECIQRNANRQRRLSDLCIMAINATYDPPASEEGWDDILFIKEAADFESYLASN